MNRERPILFFVNCERTVLFSVKRDQDPPLYHPHPPSESTRNVLTRTQWLMVISIFVSVVGIYKREEIKKVFFQKSASGHPSITCHAA